MASLLPIKALDGPGDYLRWKESLLLRARTLGVARVLFAARPAVYGDEDKWALDDALCRGHILASLSDRLLPDYARFATAAELWRALARTYDVHVREDCQNRFNEFCFKESPGEIFLEQIAHAEALGAAAGLSDDAMALALGEKLPPLVSKCFDICSRDWSLKEKGMELVWKLARAFVRAGVGPEYLWKTQPATRDHEEGCSDNGLKPEQNTASRKRGMSGHAARNCRRKA